MSGSLYEGHDSVVEEMHAAGQQQLSSFGSQKHLTVAIASRDTVVAQAADRSLPELCVQPKARKRFNQYAAGFRTNSAVSSPHKRAYDEAGIADSYELYLTSSVDTQAAITQIVSDLEEGRDVNIVFDQKVDEMAYSDVLHELIEQRVDSKFSFRA
jgi:hypothetical protein